MSILIKGMEMPDKCALCDAASPDSVGWSCPLIKGRPNIDNQKGRRKDCPLVPVPPHGRLIDKDALEADISASVVFSGRDGNAEIVGAKKIINRLHVAPTIIEAEEGET